MSNHSNINRRELLRYALFLAGATATTGCSFSDLTKTSKGDTKFLKQKHLATLFSLADTLIPVTDTPGAIAAGVPDALDAMLLKWASPETRKLITKALDRLDEQSKSISGKSFHRLPSAEQKEFLIEHDKMSLQPIPAPQNAPQVRSLTPKIYVVDEGYHRLKNLIITLYYTSEIGMTQELVYEHIPGKWIPSLKITPGMRPFASPTLF
jgi:hypothetical protein